MSGKFKPAVSAPADIPDSTLWFVIRRFRILVTFEDNRARVPSAGEIAYREIPMLRQQYLGTLDGLNCFASEVDEKMEPPEGWEFQGLRRLFGAMDENIFALAGTAVQIIDWDRTSQFCGRCGAPTADHERERAKECTTCGLLNYPRISPAIIVRVNKDNSLLLAHAHRHPPGFYSVLAGFVEPGESLEEAVIREIKEEVGIDVQNICYFGSQPWPFPNSLMIAFTCQHAEGELVLEDEELADAGWFAADNLPPIPPKISIARQLIDAFVLEQQN